MSETGADWQEESREENVFLVRPAMSGGGGVGGVLDEVFSFNFQDSSFEECSWMWMWRGKV